MAADRPIQVTQQNKVSLATAKVVPVILVLIVAYCSYVVVGPLSINYLINAPDDLKPRVAAGIAIPIVWFALLIPVAATYLRLLLVVFLAPGYTDIGNEKLRDDPSPEFWMRDVFVCDANGRPIWCSFCESWKPDRAHHNQDVGRCTLKMDHFCPWVGGVVGERSIKFFLQFLLYAMVLCLYLTIVMAYFVHERRSNVQWDLALGLGGFFLFFTLGMVLNSLHLAFLVLLPPELQASVNGNLPLAPERTARTPSSRSPLEDDEDSERPLTSEIDDPSHSRYFSNNNSNNRAFRRATKSEFWRGTVTYPLQPATDRPPLPAPQSRTFAILETPPRMNPWDLGTPYRNFTNVLGEKMHDWLLPLKRSPLAEHSSDVSFYPLGPQFENFLEDAGLVQYSASNQKDSTVSSRRGRKRKVDPGWQNGERPDGYFVEKETRRQRKEARRAEREQEWQRERDVVQ
ncbi:Palmitoyltransferase pfa5 [Recurvomyces mirabilis]|uniref:Palmitoyltransferase n=1 Tax=Recurvomyces mirabilis TaxID=574656 RepID=A0AAE0WSE9_9PEZI|nr:Palmitoyltransferase pfa5 [Recurvomyces mirabilis]KAK5156996.1 Palmitoyltransferase pfa5 [Recurvomyces mirabilis]